jgi:hypothetical protein
MAHETRRPNITNSCVMPADERRATRAPKQERLRIEDATIESAQEVLRDSPEGALCWQDELSGWFGSMDKYDPRTADTVTRTAGSVLP